MVFALFRTEGIAACFMPKLGDWIGTPGRYGVGRGGDT